jgi:hypothetical protein
MIQSGFVTRQMAVPIISITKLFSFAADDDAK